MRSRRPPASSRHPAILRPRPASEGRPARPARASVSARRGRRVSPDRAGSPCVFFFKQKTAYEIGLGIPAEPLFRSTLFPILASLLVRLVVLLPFQLLR